MIDGHQVYEVWGSLWLAVLLLSCTKAGAKPGAAEPPPAWPRLLARDFDFTEQSFPVFAQEYVEPVYREKVLRQGAEFLQLLAAVIEQQRTKPYLSLMVDKNHALRKNYAPGDLVALEKYPVLNLARKQLHLRKLLIADLLEMNAAAQAEGVSLSLGSAYRSFAYQRDVFKRYAQRDGMDAANRDSARAGESQHQLGLVIDFVPISQAFADTAAGQWLYRHALDYGFSLSYPMGQEAITGYIYEPWHYRYVGRPIATLISRYFNEFQQQFYLFWLAAAPELKRHYQSPLRKPLSGGRRRDSLR